MTLVVAFRSDNKVPTVVGDLLVSSPAEEAAKVVQLPTIKSSSLILPSTAAYVPSGVAQKVAVIGGNLVVGWSGNLREAKDTLASLYHLSKTGGLNPETLEAYLGGEEGPAYVGFLLRTEDILGFGYRSTRLESASLGLVRIIGSGYGDAVAVLKQFEVLEASQVRTGGAEPTAGDLAVVRSLAFSGSLLASEIATHRNFANYYGAGYEIATQRPDGFRKLDNITYVFWTARKVSEYEVRVSQAPFQVCVYGYTGDVLTIRSVSIEENPAGYELRQWYDHVGPIYRDISDEERSKLVLPPFNSKYLCNYFIMQDTGEVLCDVSCRVSDLKQGIYFEEHSDHTQIAVQEEYIKAILFRLFERNCSR